MLNILLWIAAAYVAAGIMNLCIVMLIDDFRNSLGCILLWPVMWLLLLFLKITNARIL
jgi:hypothetical protein